MMVYKLLERASMRWYKLRGYRLIEKVMNNVQFIDGMEMKEAA
jgi:hypothetical protein